MPVRYPGFRELVEFNKKAVSLTGDEHLYDSRDEARLQAILDELRTAYDEETGGDKLIWKASFLIYRIAAGQHFHEGNKRTALIAGAAFLEMNGCRIDIENESLLKILDRCAIRTATLKDVHQEIERLIKNDQ